MATTVDIIVGYIYLFNLSKFSCHGDPQTQVSYTMFSVLCIGPYSSFSSCRLFAIPGRACVCLVFLYVL